MQRVFPFQTSKSRGFTLIELMVALTGGLIFSAFVFLLAKDTTRFYQNELRLSAATQNVVTGFQRLRTDIARAGYLSTPNVRLDPSTCAAAGLAGTPLADLATLRIDTTKATQHSIELMGSYASADTFPARAILPGGGGLQVFLQPQSAAMVRLLGQGAAALTADAIEAALGNVFMTGRVLRVVDKAGAQQFGLITDIGGGVQPFIQLSGAPPLQMKNNDLVPCGLRGTEAGSLVNVVQRIQYSVETLTAADPNFGALFQGVEAAGQRFDLLRTELDWIDGTTLGRELVAEYAVALQFSLTVANVGQNFRITPVADGDMGNFAGAPATARPELIRAVRTRLAVRSAAPDRGGDLLAADNTLVAPGLYRTRVNPGEDPPRFARVRTLQADIALRNQRNARW